MYNVQRSLVITDGKCGSTATPIIKSGQQFNCFK